MKKTLLMMMAVVAIALTGCKSKTQTVEFVNTYEHTCAVIIYDADPIENEETAKIVMQGSAKSGESVRSKEAIELPDPCWARFFIGTGDIREDGKENMISTSAHILKINVNGAYTLRLMVNPQGYPGYKLEGF